MIFDMLVNDIRMYYGICMVIAIALFLFEQFVIEENPYFVSYIVFSSFVSLPIIVNEGSPEAKVNAVVFFALAFAFTEFVVVALLMKNNFKKLVLVIMLLIFATMASCTTVIFKKDVRNQIITQTKCVMNIENPVQCFERKKN